MPDSSFSDPIDPKTYPTYEEYLEALDARRKFEEKSQAVGDVMKKSKTDEDLIGNMGAIGLTYYEDEFCERKWCKKNEMCLLTTLESIQENYNEYFFNGTLSEKDYFVSEKVMDEMLCGKGCSLPWKNPKTMKAIEFLLTVNDALCLNNGFNKSLKTISKKEAVKRFGRDLYLFIFSIINNRDAKPYRERLESSFNANEIFDEGISKTFLKMMKTLCN